MIERVAHCAWCGKKLSRGEYKEAEKTLLCVCFICNKKFDELIGAIFSAKA